MGDNPILGFFKLYDDVCSPTFSTINSACFDLKAYFTNAKERIVIVYNKDNRKLSCLASSHIVTDPLRIRIEPGDRVLIPTGLIFNIPDGFSVRIHARSGLSLKSGLVLANSEGIIDSDYVEPVYIMVTNISNESIFINNGDRIAQAELIKKENYTLEQINFKPGQKTDRIGGFGSTGI